MNRITLARTAVAVLFFLSSPLAFCVDASPDDVLIDNGTVKLTRGDYEADLLRVPPDMRNEFASDPKRLTAMLNNILINKTLAAQARQAGVDRDPEVARRIALEGDKILAQTYLDRVEEQAGAEFDAKQADYLAKARETYLVESDKYRVPERAQIAHILFSTKERSPEAALALANETRAKLLAGADFNALAKELSDDPAAKKNGGELGWMANDRSEPEFSQAAFALKNVGDISEPVRSSHGYHLIKLEGHEAAHRLTFEEAKGQIMAGLRARYVKEQREAKIGAIRSDPNMKIDQKAVDGLVYQVDPNLFGQFSRPRAK